MGCFLDHGDTPWYFFIYLCSILSLSYSFLSLFLGSFLFNLFLFIWLLPQLLLFFCFSFIFFSFFSRSIPIFFPFFSFPFVFSFLFFSLSRIFFFFFSFFLLSILYLCSIRFVTLYNREGNYLTTPLPPITFHVS